MEIRRSSKRLGFASLASALNVGFVLLGACSSDAVEQATSDAGPSDDANVTTDGGPSDASTHGSIATYRSGSRLLAEILRAGDAVRFERFFDTKRNETCTFMETADGEYRCLPTWTAAKYADSSCGKPTVAHLSTCGADTRYAVATVGSTGCARQFRPSAIYPIGDVSEGETYDKLVDGRCEPRPPAEETRRVLGPEIPFTEFVKATVVTANVTEDLAVERLVAEDGSELTLDRQIDRTRDAKCSIWRVGAPDAESIACLPKVAYAFEKMAPWANASCTEPAAQSFTPEGCPAGEVIARESLIGEDDLCGPYRRLTVHERGAELATIYEGAECTSAKPWPDTRFFSVGPELPVASFPAIEETLFGEGRLRVVAFAKAGIPLGTSDFLDTGSKSRCAAASFTDGKLYCVPRETRPSSPTQFFKDPSCLQPVYVDGPCHPVTVLIDGDPTCDGAGHDTTVTPLGAPFELATYYMKSETCEPIVNDAGLVAYDILAPVPVGELLVEITRVRE